MTTITGRTRLFGVIADPIQQVRACEVFNPLFEARGIDAVLVPLHVSAAALEGAMAGFRALDNLGGVLVTIPHKERVLDLVDAIGPQAALVGAANVVRRDPEGRLTAENFDGLGFVAGLRQAGHEVASKRVLLVGAGGAGKAIACALATAGIGGLVIANRTRARAQALAERVKTAVPGVNITTGYNDPRGFDLVVNATSSGLAADDPLPFDVERLDPRTVVAEIIMKPERTDLVAAASARGNPVHLGRHMLDAQAPLIAGFLGIDQNEG